MSCVCVGVHVWRFVCVWGWGVGVWMCVCGGGGCVKERESMGVPSRAEAGNKEEGKGLKVST